MKKILLSLLASLSIVACAKSTTTAETSIESSLSATQIKDNLIQQIPGLTKIDAVNPTPLKGIYEVIVGRKVFYVSTNGAYAIFGNILDLATKKSITEEKMQSLAKVDFSKLPLNLAIKEINGNGKRALVVFSDPDCHYCKLLEKDIIPHLKDVTIYTFLFPLPNHPNANSDAKKIWCSKNKTQTWVSWMREGKILPANTKCDTSALDKSLNIGTDVVQVEGTPTIILQNGQILSGMLPPEQFNAKLDAIANNSNYSSAK